MPDYRDFDSLNVLTIIEGTLVNESPLRIGVGGEPPLGSSVDMVMYRVNGSPCIPGSSLKGALRSLAESLAKSKGIAVHDPWDDDAAKKEEEGGDFCAICGIFGNTRLSSHVRIYDSTPKDPRETKTFYKYGIAIDRDFGSVRSGLGPFVEEFVEPGVKWHFRMDILNIEVLPEPKEGDLRASIIKELLKMMREPGLQVGARKSVGAGLIKLKEAKWRTYRLENGRLKLSCEGALYE
ncbi:RAMP superfamily CRISPR-associated protein [Thermofilum sp.]|uniref:RAMP superfamily CRISPR-associated protein n=1 Tax=Thermofilum sp. TaxID=1961369 RepID=UPI003160C8AE